MLGCDLILGTVLCGQLISRAVDSRKQDAMFPVAYSESFQQPSQPMHAVMAVDMKEFIKADFSGVPSVSDVIVNGNTDDFEVRVFLKDFDRAELRRRVYAKERAFYKEFPEYSFDFLLFDASDQSDNVLQEPAY